MAQNPLRKWKKKTGRKLFEISGIYLVNNDNKVIEYREKKSQFQHEADVFSWMFDAMIAFIEKSSQSIGDLGNIEYGNYKILTERGSDFSLVIIGKGDDFMDVKRDMTGFVRRFSDGFAKARLCGMSEERTSMLIKKEIDSLIESFET